MSQGTPIEKQYVIVLQDGTFAVDWGNGRVQDLMTGDFLQVREADFAHVIYDAELDVLKRRGRVVDYDSQHVYLAPLPEGGLSMLD